MKILIVDDNAVTRRELTELLTEDGHEAAACASGEEALSALQGAPRDLVITDLRMPGISGLEVLAKVKGLHPQAYVVMITGYATIETAIEAMKKGAYDYIRKPFQLSHIKEVIQGVEEERRLRASMESAEGLGSAEVDVFRFFESVLGVGRGLCISKVPTEELRSKYRWTNVELYHLSPEPGPGRLHPRDLYRITGVIDSAMAAAGDGLTVLIQGIELLPEAHSWEEVRPVLSKLFTGILERNGRLILGADPQRLEPRVLAELRQIISNTYAQLISDSLASPIRRGILRCLADHSPANFTTIMRKLDVRDSPKLSFHLRKLVADGLIARTEEAYMLQRRGRVALEMLDVLEKRGMADAQNTASLILG